MCGICGIWGEANREAVERMVAAMRHRGPDDAGVFVGVNATLGAARLSILDLSAAGHQPMAGRNPSLQIAYNGEMYNFREERKILEGHGHTFRSASDTEVILRMYEHYGDEFLKRIRGMFALAIYDARKGPGRERLLLARDLVGIKPLLYAECGRRVVFASEMKALLASGMIGREIAPEALRMLLAYGSVRQPWTMLRGVWMLPPAHRLIVEAGGLRLERYWSLAVDRHAGLRSRPYDEQVDALTEALRESVRMHLVSDVPVGAFLSGGVDSSLLVALMTQEVGRNTKTFSVGFEAEGAEIDETGEAEITARFLGSDHSRVVVTGHEVRQRIEHIAWSLDQPSVNGVNSYFISQAARRAVTVAISGTGGDELFAGYPWFIEMALHARDDRRHPLRSLAWALAASSARLRIFDSLVDRRGGARLYRLRAMAGFIPRYAETYNIFGSVGAARLLNRDLRGPAQAGRSPLRDLQAEDELPRSSLVNRVTALCLRGYTCNQLLRDIDATSMAHSLEVRVPFLDVAVMDLALSLPDQVKLGNLDGLPAQAHRTYRATGAKRILVDAGRRRLPKDLDQQVKRGFGMPFGSWLKGPLKDVMMDALSDDQIRRRGLVDIHEVSHTRTAFLDGAIGWPQPWLLMMLELWCREILDRRACPSPAPLPSGLAAGKGAESERPLVKGSQCAPA